MQPCANPNIVYFNRIDPPGADCPAAATIHRVGLETQDTPAWRDHILCGNVMVADKPADSLMQPYGTPPEEVERRVRSVIETRRAHLDSSNDKALRSIGRIEAVLRAYGPSAFTVGMRPVKYLDDGNFTRTVTHALREATHVKVNGHVFAVDGQHLTTVA